MFRSDKDVSKLGSRRGAQGRGSSGTRGGEGRNEVLEKARRERAERERARASRGQAMTIQRWYRGRSVAARARAKDRADWDKKMSDYGTLQRALAARGIPFTPPLKFVLSSMQQLLFFYRVAQDSSRLRLYCESVLTLCVSQPDPSLNPAAHLLGIADVANSSSDKGRKGEEGRAAEPAALKLRLKTLLAVCLGYVGKELNQGVTEGNSPLKVLLMLTGCEGHASCPSGMLEPGLTPEALQARAVMSRFCMGILVNELKLLSAVREVLLGSSVERLAVASAGGSTPPRPPPGRQGAIFGSWELALQALDLADTLSPRALSSSSLSCSSSSWRTSASLSSKSVSTPQQQSPDDGFSSFFRASYVAMLLSVPLLLSRLGTEGVGLLLQRRRRTFIVCLRDFWEAMASASPDGGIETKNGVDAAPGAFALPSSPVSCCGTEAFLVGNLIALGTKLSLDGGGGGGDGAGGSAVRAEQRDFMRVVTCLLELPAIPDSLLTDRQAITLKATGHGGDGGKGGGGGTSMTALAVPQAVQDQVRLLVSDRWVRAASKKALEGVNEGLLKRATEDERKETKETLESSAANLAMASVRRYRAEANRNFVSKWAEKLRQSSKKWFTNVATDHGPTSAISVANTAPELPPAGAGSGLIDASAASRAAAMGELSATGSGGGKEGAGGGSGDGGGVKGVVDPMMRPHAYDRESVLALCELLSVLLRRWGTGANAANPVIQGVMNTLCFSFPCVARLWAFVLNESSVSSSGSSPSSFDRLCDTAPVDSAEGGGMYASLAVLMSLFGHMLVVLDDAELYEAGEPLPLHHINKLVRGIKRPLFAFCWEASEVRPPPGHFRAFFAGAAERLLRGLYVRSSRRALCRSEAWIIPQAESNRVLTEVKAQSPRARRLLRCMPYCMSLTQRMRVFEHLVKTDKAKHQPENTPGVPIRVRRGHVLEDGLTALGSGGRAERQAKKRLVVIYTGAAGHEESGIDMGGLFKDFWLDLSALAFDVNYGLFRVTKEGLMYPNPSSSMVHGSEHLRLFEFLGRILGKALYEGITVQPEFATFFLGFIRGDYNFLHLFHDLHGLDPELYKNLMFLKTYSGGDVEDLCLTFTVAEDAFGANTEVELVRGGSRRAVTSANRLEYVNRVAKYHLVDGLKPQAEAFVRGLWEVIDPLWLQMFSEPELQVLISGSNKTLDVEDLKRHTKYSGGFVGMDRSVRRFWSVVDSMNDTERAALLRFVTSCERPPPLGFESMHPPFCVHRVGIRSDRERLPTASTCFNTLKLPTYSSEKVMKAKLLTSIFSGTGFELS